MSLRAQVKGVLPTGTPLIRISAVPSRELNVKTGLLDGGASGPIVRARAGFGAGAAKGVGDADGSGAGTGTETRGGTGAGAGA